MKYVLFFYSFLHINLDKRIWLVIFNDESPLLGRGDNAG